MCFIQRRRDVAQPGSALVWGTSGRWFKSSRPDHIRERAFSTLTGSPFFIGCDLFKIHDHLLFEITAFIWTTMIDGSGGKLVPDPEKLLVVMKEGKCYVNRITN